MKRSTFGWITAAVLMAGAVVLLVFYLTLRQIASAPGAIIDSTGEALAEIARAFRQGSVEIRFSNYAAEISGTQNLQFATLNEREVFERLDSASVLWGRVPLPDIVVEATAPVEYTYYVDLRGRWRFAVVDEVVRVTAPEIEFNEPAIDASEIEYRVRQDSMVRDADEAMEKLRSVLTDLARERARDNVELVREVGRRQVEEFVRTWLGQEFGDGDKLRIDVVFADEERLDVEPLAVPDPESR